LKYRLMPAARLCARSAELFSRPGDPAQREVFGAREQAPQAERLLRVR